MDTSILRIRKAALKAMPKALKTSLWLLKIIIPVSFTVSLLNYFGVIEYVSQYLEPVFSIVGLPGNAAIVFLSSIFLSLYAPIAIIATLPLDGRDIVILAVMCLIAHNLLVECAVQQKTGSNYLLMFLLRIFSAFLVAYVLNLFLPTDLSKLDVSQTVQVSVSLIDELFNWLVSTILLVFKMTLIICGLMVLQHILDEFKVLDYLSRKLSPVMDVLGLPHSVSFLWLIAHTLGLTYGAAVMMEEVATGKLVKEDAKMLNLHIAVNHSTLEDTFLFAAIGVPVLWMVVPRFLLSMLLVWCVRLLKIGLKCRKSLFNDTNHLSETNKNAPK